MGPPSLNGGNENRNGSTEAISELQWGRRLSTAETSNAPVMAVATETLQWGRRLSTAETHPQIGTSRFVVGLQWGRRLSTAETDLSGGRVAGGGSVLQWGRRLSTAETGHRERTYPPPRRFNGAAVSQRRKLALAAYEDLCRRLQWGRRLSTAETLGRTQEVAKDEVASMGPPSLNGGNGTPRAHVSSAQTLQWGRRLSTAETRPGGL